MTLTVTLLGAAAVDALLGVARRYLPDMAVEQQREYIQLLVEKHAPRVIRQNLPRRQTRALIIDAVMAELQGGVHAED